MKEMRKNMKNWKIFWKTEEKIETTLQGRKMKWWRVT